MADAVQNASPAPAVATESTGDKPKIESKSPENAPAPSIKTESKAELLDAPQTKPSPVQTAAPATSGTSPATAPPASAATPANAPAPAPAPAAEATSAQSSTPPPATVKTEPLRSPETSSLAQLLSIAIPAATNAASPPLAAATGAIAASGDGSATPASAVPASIVMQHASVPTPAISPLSDVPPTKRSRTPEEREEAREEKRQKKDHVVEKPQDQPGEAVKQTDALNLGATKETRADAGGNIDGNGGELDPDLGSLLSWDLEAQLSSVLGSVDVDAAKDSNASDDEDKMDTTPIPLLPPPRKRLEKMKFIENPTYFSRAMGLPMLGSLSVQILLALFQQPSEVTDRQIRDVRTEGGKVYSALRSTFMAVLKLFTDATVFLSADDLDIHDPGDRETIQMANLASMCASFYGPGGPTMATAHDNFLKIMIPENGIITEDISDLYLDQKTQSFLAYANVMEDKESTRNSLMDKFFPLDLEDKLKAYWRESNLSMSAEEFVKPYTERRNLLKAIGHDKEKRKALEAKYQFASFLDNLSAFIRSNFDSILDYAESHGFEVPNEAGEEELMLLDAQSTYAGSFPGQPRRSNGTEGGYDSLGLASLITEKLNGLDGYSYSYGSSGIPESTTLPPGQSLPTSVLYERARQAAVAKPSAQTRREGLHSTRRPWSPEEEKALMAGLDLVKGPHWSQILQLFGLNGTLSDILKDRTQVQLKDKARNLKLFFLKTNSEMPYYLQCVTGELKTRAPSQAARKEAEEQARVQAGGSPGTYASTYMNGSNGTSTLTHTMAGSPRPGSTTPSGGPTTPIAGQGTHHQGQQTYQQHQGYHQQTYQQQRPAPIQPAPNGASHSPAITSYAAATRPLQPQPSHHQPIAPAPSYQRPLQQAGAPAAAQYQQRSLQQPAIQTPATYQQAQQQAQRPVAPSSSAATPRPIHQSTASQSQARPAATGGAQPHSVIHRPPTASTAAQPRSGHLPPQASNPPNTPASIPKGVQPNAPGQPAQQHSTQTPQSTAQPGTTKPIPPTQPRPAAPAATPATVPASKPSPAAHSAPAPNPPPTPAQTAESKQKAEEELLAKTLKAAIDSA